MSESVGVTDYTNQTHLSISDEFNTRKYLSNVHKKEGTLLQCVNYYYAKFECKEIRTVPLSAQSGEIGK